MSHSPGPTFGSGRKDVVYVAKHGNHPLYKTKKEPKHSPGPGYYAPQLSGIPKYDKKLHSKFSMSCVCVILNFVHLIDPNLWYRPNVAEASRAKGRAEPPRRHTGTPWSAT